MTGERQIFLATQHDATVDEPTPAEIYEIGTLGRILQAQRLENGQIKVVVEGRERGRSMRVEQDADGMFYAGDDLGDVEAFKAIDDLRGAGMVALLVCSGSEEQEALVELADLVVPGPDGVMELLARLAQDARDARQR